MNQLAAPEQNIDRLHTQLKNAVVMMVDDEPLLMDLFQAFLQEAGYKNFITIEDSRQALGTLDEQRPDILLLDLNMPHVDGFAILEAAQQRGISKRIPVIVLTSSSDAQSKLRALELGATDFLSKPVDPSELVLRVRNTLTVKTYQDQLTYYDSLTRLPNRTLFIERLEWLLKMAARESKRVAVMTLGLDRFKQINDSLGPALGDEVLMQVAARLDASVRETDLVTHDMSGQLARLGGDEFSIVLHGMGLDELGTEVARRLLETLTEKIIAGENEVYISANIGIALYPNDGEDADLLIKNAGAAMAFAKDQGKGNYQFYSREINAVAQQRLSLEAGLRRAIEREEFVLKYQPKVDCRSGKVIGCEALIRWESSELGVVPPDKFIGLAEETGLIVPMGDWVIRTACRQQAIWNRQGAGDLIVSVNVAGAQFQHNGLPSVIREALSDASVDAGRLKLEITESMLMSNAESLVSVLHEIRAMGPTFSIDDFGTGYSSLSYLKRFPIDELKIDRSFVVDLPGASDDAAIVRAIIAMAHSLDMTVVAEGVEKKDQVDYLKAAQCDMIQGYYYSEPLLAEEFIDFCASHH